MTPRLMAIVVPVDHIPFGGDAHLTLAEVRLASCVSEVLTDGYEVPLRGPRQCASIRHDCMAMALANEGGFGAADARNGCRLAIAYQIRHLTCLTNDAALPTSLSLLVISTPVA